MRARQVEEVVHTVISLELPPPPGSQLLGQQPEYLPEVALRELTFYTSYLLPEGIEIRCIKPLNLRCDGILIVRARI